MMSEAAIVPISKELADELARQGEARLNALVSLATASDLRATTLCGIFGAASVAVGAAVLAEASADNPIQALIVPGSIVAAGWLISALLSAIAGAPCDFFISGGNPDSLRNWLWSSGQWRSEAEMLDATAARYAQSIAENNKILKKGSKRVIFALIIALASPVLGLLSYFALNNFR